VNTEGSVSQPDETDILHVCYMNNIPELYHSCCFSIVTGKN